MQRSDRQASGVRHDCRSVVALDEVQAEVEPGGGTGRGEDVAVVRIEHLRIQSDGRMSGCERVRGEPMSRRVPTVEQAGPGER